MLMYNANIGDDFYLFYSSIELTNEMLCEIFEVNIDDIKQVSFKEVED